jgi:hypothetical protein
MDSQIAALDPGSVRAVRDDSFAIGTQALEPLLAALPVMVLGDLRELALAIIAIGLAVAAADWAIFASAVLRLALAGARDVRASAHARLLVAPQPGRALETRNAAAHLPFAAEAVLRFTPRGQQER